MVCIQWIDWQTDQYRRFASIRHLDSQAGAPGLSALDLGCLTLVNTDYISMGLIS